MSSAFDLIYKLRKRDEWVTRYKEKGTFTFLKMCTWLHGKIVQQIKLQMWSWYQLIWSCLLLESLNGQAPYAV